TIFAQQLLDEQPFPIRQAACYTKALPTFSDTLAFVHQHLWPSTFFFGLVTGRRHRSNSTGALRSPRGYARFCCLVTPWCLKHLDKGSKKNKRSKEIWYTPKTDDLEEKDGTDRGAEGPVDQDSQATQRKRASSVSGTHGENPRSRWGQPS